MREHAAVTTASPPTRTRVFPARPDQVREARKFVSAVLDGSPVADDALLCVSELATNSVLHSASQEAGGTFTVRAAVQEDDYVRIEVEDAGGPWHEHPRHDDHPHGLDIVRALAADSGIDGDAVTGWLVWARLDLPRPARRPANGDQPSRVCE
jgi:hypothetical protein